MVVAAELAHDRRRLVDGASDEVGILAVGSIPVAAVEDADGVVVDGGQGLEVADEAMLVVDLERWLVRGL